MTAREFLNFSVRRTTQCDALEQAIPNWEDFVGSIFEIFLTLNQFSFEKEEMIE